MKCDFPDCDLPAEVYVIRRRSAGPYGGWIKIVQYRVGAIINIDDPKDTIAEKRCMLHGMWPSCMLHGIPKLYWRRHLQNSLDFLKGV
jgi:hypothetical protein